jgi:hypothetical protein
MRTVKTTLAAVLCLSAGLALPAGAAANGGLAAPEPGSARTGATAPGSSDGALGALTAGRGALFGRRQRITGTLGRAAGQDVLVQRSDRSAGWVTIARARTGSGGAFAATWRADSVGRLTLRAVPAVSGAAAAASAAPTAPMTVYRADIATHFGEGFYGTRTACGITLTPRTVGVAHKTLPCGTVLEFFYRGRTVRAPVVDRGPYANHAAWDLTMAASRSLGFSGKDYVGAIAVGRVKLSRSG